MALNDTHLFLLSSIPFTFELFVEWINFLIFFVILVPLDGLSSVVFQNHNYSRFAKFE